MKHIDRMVEVFRDWVVVGGESRPSTLSMSCGASSIQVHFSYPWYGITSCTAQNISLHEAKEREPKTKDQEPQEEKNAQDGNVTGRVVETVGRQVNVRMRKVTESATSSITCCRRRSSKTARCSRYKGVW